LILGVEHRRDAFDHHHRLLQQQQVRLGLHVEIARDVEQSVEHLPDRQLAYRQPRIGSPTARSAVANSATL
jgi:serine phosphatase RsbU (regulator of sigma subunit)